MALVDLMARLRADPSGFKAGLTSAQRDLNSFQAQTYTAARGVEGAFTRIGAAATSVAAFLAPLGAAMSLGSLVNNAREFESAMGVIQAASGATGRDLALAESTIREVGVAMGFGARETATAAEELLKAGLAVEDLAAGALRASVVMAAATGGTMAEGANIAVRAMMNFNVQAEDLSEVVQQAAGVINATTFDLNDYSLALGMAANSAASMGVTLEDFNATIALTASAFSSGSDAGTSFKTFLQRLVPSSAEAERAMRDLNFSAFDANGEFVGMEEVTRRLEASFGDLSREERARAIITIFGSDAQRTANTLINEGAEALARMRDETLQQADANVMAAARWQGVNGAISQMSANWEELSIALGQSGVNEFIANFIRGLAGLIAVAREAVEWMNRLNPDYINTSTQDVGDLEGQLGEQRETLRRRQQRLNRVNDAVRRQSQNGSSPSGRVLRDWAEATAEVMDTQERIRELERAIEDIRFPIVDVREDLGELADDPALAQAIADAEEYAERIANAGTAIQQADREITRTANIEADKRKRIAVEETEARIRAAEDAAERKSRAERAPTQQERIGTAVDGLAEAMSWELEQQFVSGEFDWDRIGETLMREWRQVLWDVFVGDQIRDVMTQIANALKNVIGEIFGPVFSGGGINGGNTGGGWINSAINFVASMFGGNRAGGGPVASGRAYKVGETGPEWFTPPGMGGGNIVPEHAIAAHTASGVSMTYAPTIDARGVDAAQVARIDRQQRELIANFEDMTVRVVNSNIARRKIR